MVAEKSIQKRPLSSYRPPPGMLRRGSFAVRMALRRIRLRQNPKALKAAARMVLLLPLLQSALLVGILKAETWMLLLGLEGLLIAWLAATQLSRPTPESKLTGYGIAVLNTCLLGAAGLFLGSNVYWVTGLIGLAPVTWLVFSVTGRNTVKLAWAAYVIPLLLVLLVAATGRWALISSESEPDPQARRSQLAAAWYVMLLRGANGNERGLLRLRQAQAAFEASDYEAAYALADDGLYYADRRLRPFPESLIGADLIDSLIMIKAQAFYNHHWDKQDQIRTPIQAGPLDEEALTDKNGPVRWGW
jgi:hypothetical protein